MRTLFVIALIMLPLGGASAVSVDDQIAMVRQLANTERQAIVTANMNLTEEESAGFWPMYREYRAAMAELGDRRIALIKDYAENYAELSEDKARELLEESFEIQSDRISVRRKYARKMRGELSEVKVARFMQIDSKIDAVYDLELSSQIPLAK